MADKRLIDANALLKEFEKRQEQQINEFCDCFLNDAQELSTEWWCVEDAVAEAPTIDAVEVVHGKWESCWEDWRHQLEGNKCSVCGFEYFGNLFKYCPNCGAKMDAKDMDVPTKDGGAD